MNTCAISDSAILWVDKLVDNVASWAGLDMDWVQVELAAAVLPGGTDGVLLDTITNLWVRLNQEGRSVGSAHLDWLASFWHTDADISQEHTVPSIPGDFIVTVWVTEILKVVIGTPGIVQN